MMNRFPTHMLSTVGTYCQVESNSKHSSTPQKRLQLQKDEVGAGPFLGWVTATLRSLEILQPCPLQEHSIESIVVVKGETVSVELDPSSLSFPTQQPEGV